MSARKCLRKAPTGVPLAVLFLCLTHTGLEAQHCIGLPTAPGQTALEASIGFPDGGNILGVAVHHRPASGPFAVRGRFEHHTWYTEPAMNMNSLGSIGTYDLTREVVQVPGNLSFCATGGFMYGRLSSADSFLANIMEIPVGVALGGILRLGEADENGGGGLALIPWVAPAIYHSRESWEGGSMSSTDVDIILGGTMLFDWFFASLDLQQIFRDSSAGSSVWCDRSYATLRFGLLF